jgi:glutamine synthetase
MSISVQDALEYVKDNDVKFIRLVFCDLFGVQKNISILPDELETAFLDGISFDASEVNGFCDVANSDLFLFPDSSTMMLLPWRPQQGKVIRFYCDIKTIDKTNYCCNSRNILRNSLQKLVQKGYSSKVATECEFYLFKNDSEGNPTKETLDKGTYMDMFPLDKAENVRREICINLEDMGLKPEKSHHENGPGQNEVDFMSADPLKAADNFMTFKTVVKVISARHGLFASFMPKPLLEKPGNGLHINFSLFKDGENLFDQDSQNFSTEVKSFIAGILSKTPEMTLFLNPLPNSYERLSVDKAPKYISWSPQNRSQLVRIPAAVGLKKRMELRSPDPAVNPYLALSLIIGAGLYGIENNLSLPKSIDANLYELKQDSKFNIEKIPENISQAIKLAKSSIFIKETIGEASFNKFIEQKEKEEKEFLKAEDKRLFYLENYFMKI